MLIFNQIHEQLLTPGNKYIIGDINLNELIANRDIFNAPDVFIANIPIFFIDRD